MRGPAAAVLTFALLVVVETTAAHAQTGVRGAPNAPPPGGAALEAHTVQLGDRVRAWLDAEARPREGPVVGVSYQGMTVVVRDHAENIPFASLGRLEVRRTRNHPGRGALIGLAAGLLASIYVVNEDVLDRHLDGWERAAGTVAMGALGAGAGALTGAFVHTGGWRSVDVGPRGATAALPGPRIAVKIRF